MLVLPTVRRCSDILEKYSRDLKDIARFLEPGDRAAIKQISEGIKEISEKLLTFVSQS
jgi:hypothetical protein